MQCTDHDDRRYCQRKRAYIQRVEAHRKAKKLKKSPTGAGRSYGVHRCPTCGLWHVGSRRYGVGESAVSA